VILGYNAVKFYLRIAAVFSKKLNSVGEMEHLCVWVILTKYQLETVFICSDWLTNSLTVCF